MQFQGLVKAYLLDYDEVLKIIFFNSFLCLEILSKTTPKKILTIEMIKKTKPSTNVGILGTVPFSSQ